MTASPNDTLMSVHQVGARLGVSVATVWRWRDTNPGFPKPVKLSKGCTRWSAAAIDTFLAEKGALG